MAAHGHGRLRLSGEMCIGKKRGDANSKENQSIKPTLKISAAKRTCVLYKQFLVCQTLDSLQTRNIPKESIPLLLEHERPQTIYVISGLTSQR